MKIESRAEYKFFSNGKRLKKIKRESLIETEFNTTILNSIEEFCVFGLQNFEAQTLIQNHQQLNVYHKKEINGIKYKLETIKDVFHSVKDWLINNFEINIPSQIKNLIFMPNYINVATSHTGGIMVVNSKFIEEHCDIIDWNYFKTILVCLS